MPWRDRVAESDNRTFLQSPNGPCVHRTGGIPGSSTPSHRRRSEISDRRGAAGVMGAAARRCTGRGGGKVDVVHLIYGDRPTCEIPLRWPT